MPSRCELGRGHHFDSIVANGFKVSKPAKPKLVPYLFGPLPTEGINGALGLELDPGDVVMSIRAQRHAQFSHPKDYARCFPHVASIVTGPLYVRDDFRNENRIEMVGKAAGFPDWLLVAVEIAVDDDGRYNVTSFYPVSAQKVENRKQSGHLKRVMLV
jgi:hypothetical protein